MSYSRDRYRQATLLFALQAQNPFQETMDSQKEIERQQRQAQQQASRHQTHQQQQFFAQAKHTKPYHAVSGTSIHHPSGKRR